MTGFFDKAKKMAQDAEIKIDEEKEKAKGALNNAKEHKDEMVTKIKYATSKGGKAEKDK